jgi:hypothetical protein
MFCIKYLLTMGLLVIGLLSYWMMERFDNFLKVVKSNALPEIQIIKHAASSYLLEVRLYAAFHWL